jgi:hypothetical protein
MNEAFSQNSVYRRLTRLLNTATTAVPTHSQRASHQFFGRKKNRGPNNILSSKKNTAKILFSAPGEPQAGKTPQEYWALEVWGP